MEIEQEQEKKRAYWRAHKEKHKVRYRNKHVKWRANPENRLKQLLYCRVRKGRTRGELDFQELLSRLNANGWRCEVTGQQFVFDPPRHPQSLSLDRIDSSKDYTMDNTRMVCWWVNCAMGTWGLEKLEEMMKEWNVNRTLQDAVRPAHLPE